MLRPSQSTKLTWERMECRQARDRTRLSAVEALAASGAPLDYPHRVDIVVSPDGAGVSMARLDRAGRPGSAVNLTAGGFVDQVRELEQQDPRWVWADTSTVYPRLLRAGVTVARAVDLRLCHAVLARSTYVPGGLADADDPQWGAGDAAPGEAEPSLLDLPVEGAVLDVTELRQSTVGSRRRLPRRRARIVFGCCWRPSRPALWLRPSSLRSVCRSTEHP